MTDIIDLIRSQQALIHHSAEARPPVHSPEMLLIGCVDARLNPKTDMGIPDGAALIHRNIAALVRGKPVAGDHEGSSVGASLQLAINVMRVKHIVVMGHTDCGGIRACLEDSHSHDTQDIRRYLLPLSAAREQVVAEGGNIKAQARAMEEAAVRQSVTNLMGYQLVQDALRNGHCDIHGWVINTATKRISEMDLSSGQFTSMAAG